MPNHIQKFNFMPKFILINFISRFILTCFLISLGTPDHTHLKQTTNISCFHGPLVRSKSYMPNFFFVRYSSLKNPGLVVFGP